MYASADAARVGGGLYQAVVEALCTLATDPSPKVAAAGVAALRAANVELVPVPAAAAAAAGGSRGASPAPSRASSLTAAGSAALPAGSPASISAGVAPVRCVAGLCGRPGVRQSGACLGRSVVQAGWLEEG